MSTDTPFTAAERVESLKAAALGGGIAAGVSLAIAAVHRWPTPTARFPLGAATSLSTLTLGIAVAIATLSGALFALTYRYAVRQDTNPQLKAGVILAFALVRGLAQVNVGSAIAQHFWPFAAAGAESLALFGLAGLGLDQALRQGWVKPFGK